MNVSLTIEKFLLCFFFNYYYFHYNSFVINKRTQIRAGSLVQEIKILIRFLIFTEYTLLI